MTSYNIDIWFRDAKAADYDQFSREMNGLKKTGTQYRYRGRFSLQQLTASVWRAARNTGKDYRFTIIKEKRGI
jgi:hypothetical protein